MKPFPAFPFLLLICAAVGAGCAEKADPSGLDAAKPCPLAALRITSLTDCDSRSRFHQALQAQAPPGWKCLASKAFNARATLTYYHDGAGHVGFGFDWTDWREPVVAWGRAVIATTGGHDVVDFGPGTAGFVQFPGTYANGTIHIESYGFSASGTPSFLGTANLTMLQPDNREGPVYLWRFAAPDGSAYHFADITRRPDAFPGFAWGPTQVRVHGSDFEADLRFQRGIATTHPVDFRDRDPLGFLRPGPGCPSTTGTLRAAVLVL
ncbi:MAG: hypothetical protein LC620_06475 [Halobacteriales archaeon]|nr:hypothetical protein [Halobacteriales archaeon]